MKWPSHGANPQYLYEAMNLSMPGERIDFSANLNPLGPPPILQKNWNQLFDLLSDYPDPRGTRLKRKIAQIEGVNEEQVLIGNGGAEIISLIGRLLAGKRVLIIQPSFAEYEQACRVNGCEIEYHQLASENWDLDIESLIGKLDQVDALFFCNPSNPTGIYYPRSVLEKLIEHCAQHECQLIIDEAFYDFLSDYQSIVSSINTCNQLLIIRSMTKMFAIPGLRLGYLLANAQIIEKVADFQPHWSINALALQAGEWCLGNEEYLHETRKLIEEERDKLSLFYEKNGFEMSASKVNFYLLKDSFRLDAFPLFDYLLKSGIIPRHTMNFPGLDGRWLRFAIKNSDDNAKLMEVMTEWRKRVN